MNNDLISNEVVKMKLIIEIPDYKLDEVQNGSIASNEILKAVRNGTPISTEGDLISRLELKKAIENYLEKRQDVIIWETDMLNMLDNAPTVEPTFKPIAEVKFDKEQMQELVDKAKAEVLESIERPQDEWIPIKYRPLTVDERIAFADHYGIEYSDTIDEKAFDCPMPEDGQKILISTLWGVDIDVADNDIDGEGFICYGLDGNGDWSGVNAWRPLPERYKEGGKEE